MIRLKSAHEIEGIARAGELVAETIALVGEHIQPGVSMLDLDALAEARANQLDHQVVGDEIAAVVHVPHAAAQLRSGGHLGAEDLSARDMRDRVFGRDPLRLRAFSCPLRAEKKNVERYLRKPS